MQLRRLSIFLWLSLVVSSLPTAAQDLDARVRQHQEEAHHRIEESRARMELRRQEMQSRYQTRGQNSPSSVGQYSQSYQQASPQPNVAPAAQPATTASGSAPPNQNAGKKAPGVTGQSKAKLASKSSSPSKTQSQTKGQVAATTAGTYLELDTMQEIKIPKPQSVNWDGVWKGALRGGIVGAIIGGIAGLLAWFFTLLQRGSARDSSNSQSQLLLMLVLVLTIPGTMFATSHPEEITSTLPFLKPLFESLKTEPVSSGGPLRFAPMRSQSFLFVVSIPQPVGLERKIIEGMWTTMVQHLEPNGGYQMAYARLPSLAELRAKALQKQPEWMRNSLATQSFHYDIQAGLDGAAKSSVDFIHGTTTYKTSIALDNVYPGRQVEGKLPNDQGIFRQRIYMANGIFYQLLVVGKPNFVNTKESDRFFDSFKIKAP